MNRTRSIVETGLMIGIGLAIVTVLRSFGGQPILQLFSPMHITVLIAGLAIGPVEGLTAGVITPALSYMISGLPPQGPWAMMAELGMYGLITGLVMRCTKRIHNDTARIYMALVIAMIAGRIAGGLVQGLILSPMSSQTYTIAIWFSAYIAGTLPAIVLDLILVPVLIKALMKAGLNQNRVGKSAIK